MISAWASIRLVSLTDKVHNARSILFDYWQVGEALSDRFSGSQEETLLYYRALVTAFRATASSALIDGLDRIVTEIEQLAVI